MSCSPSSISRIGSQSGVNSEDAAAGIQYCRIISPMTVPGPTRVKSCPSVALDIPALPEFFATQVYLQRTIIICCIMQLICAPSMLLDGGYPISLSLEPCAAIQPDKY